MKFAIVLVGMAPFYRPSDRLPPDGIPLLTDGHMEFLTESYLNQLPQAIEAVLAEEYRIEEIDAGGGVVPDDCLLEALCRVRW
jgi:NAD+ kinase